MPYRNREERLTYFRTYNAQRASRLGRLEFKRMAVERCVAEEAAKTLEAELRGRSTNPPEDIETPTVGRRSKGKVEENRR